MISQDELDKLTEWFDESWNRIRWLFRLIKEQKWDNNSKNWITYITQEQIDDLLSWKNIDDED